MSAEHRCGPDHDAEFFNEADALFQKFPHLAKKYAIKCLDHEIDLLGVDYAQQIGASRVEGNRVVTQFEPAHLADSAKVDAACCQFGYRTDPRTGNLDGCVQCTGLRSALSG